MTTDPSPTLLVDLLPSSPDDLRTVLLREHPARTSELGSRWWQIARDAYEGTGGFMRSVDAVSTRDGGAGSWERGSLASGRGRQTYLTPFRRESPESFTARADRSPYTNHVGPVVDTYHGHFVRRAPKRSTTSPLVSAWWADVDGQGHDIGEWVSGVALRAQLYGWCPVLIDRPIPGDPHTVATALDPSEVRDWQYGPDGSLDWVRLVSEWSERSAVTGEIERVIEASVWTRTEWARVRLCEEPVTGWSVDVREGDLHSLGRVPLEVLRWQDAIAARTLYGLSQVQGVVPLALALFANESELTDHLANANFALLAVQSDDPAALENLAIGTNNGLRYSTMEAQPGFISPGSDVAMQYALRGEQLTEALYAAAKLERPRASATGGDAASGIARAYDFSKTDAVLQTFARQMARFEYGCVAIVAAWAANGDAAKVAAVVASTTIVYPTRYDAAGIQSDLGALFAAMSADVRPQLPPSVIREARLGVARGLFPEASSEIEAAYTAEIATMFDREVAGAASQKARVSELFGYDLDAGLITVNEYLAGKGLPPRTAGDVTIVEWRLAHGLAPDGSMPPANAAPIDHAANAAVAVDSAIAALPIG